MRRAAGTGDQIEACRAERLLVLPYDLRRTTCSGCSPMPREMSIEQIRMGIGGFISLDKVYGGNFEAYDGSIRPR